MAADEDGPPAPADSSPDLLGRALARIAELEVAIRAMRPIVASVAVRGANGRRKVAMLAIELLDKLKIG